MIPNLFQVNSINGPVKAFLSPEPPGRLLWKEIEKKINGFSFAGISLKKSNYLTSSTSIGSV